MSIVTLYEHRYIGCIHTVSSSVGRVFCSVELQRHGDIGLTTLELEEGCLGVTGSGEESLELEEGCLGETGSGAESLELEEDCLGETGLGDMVWLELLELKSSGVPYGIIPSES